MKFNGEILKLLSQSFTPITIFVRNYNKLNIIVNIVFIETCIHCPFLQTGFKYPAFLSIFSLMICFASSSVQGFSYKGRTLIPSQDINNSAPRGPHSMRYAPISASTQSAIDLSEII